MLIYDRDDPLHQQYILSTFYVSRGKFFAFMDSIFQWWKYFANNLNRLSIEHGIRRKYYWRINKEEYKLIRVNVTIIGRIASKTITEEVFHGNDLDSRGPLQVYNRRGKIPDQ